MKKSYIIITIIGLIVVGFIGYKSFFATYDVIFDSKAGTSIQAQRVKKGEKATKPEDPILMGYTFLGWYLDDSLYDFETPITKDITLTGKWEEN